MDPIFEDLKHLTGDIRKFLEVLVAESALELSRITVIEEESTNGDLPDEGIRWVSAVELVTRTLVYVEAIELRLADGPGKPVASSSPRAIRPPRLEKVPKEGAV